MEQLKKKFEDNYLLGCIKYRGELNFYLMPIAWWILNYKKYDPEYDPAKWQSTFRNNILNVTDYEIENYMKAIEEDKLESGVIQDHLIEMPSKYRHLNFFIDFDSKDFINGFDDIEVEQYLPDDSWKGRFGNPKSYLPDELKKLLEN